MKNLFVFIAILPLLSACGFEIVDTGHRGIETKYGKVVGESLPEGLYFYNPFTSNIVEMDVRTQMLAGNTQAYTKDVQQAAFAYNVNFNLSKEDAHIMYQEVGEDWQKLVTPIVEGTLKGVTGKWEAVELISNRDKAAKLIEDTVKAALAEKSIVVTKFEITNIDYADEFEKAVEAKVTAIQRAAEAKNTTVRVQEEANQKVISAKAEAESMRIRSQALAENKGLVEYTAVEKWNGVLPQYMMGSSVPFVNINRAVGNAN